jgi:hypothetical protein
MVFRDVTRYSLLDANRLYGVVSAKTDIWLAKAETNSVAISRKRTIPTERPPRPSNIVPTFAGRVCCVVRSADPYGRESRR